VIIFALLGAQAVEQHMRMIVEKISLAQPVFKPAAEDLRTATKIF
jgi:hypothetical protein